MRLLIMDDDQALGRVVAKAATLAGFEATAISDPGQFIATMRANTPAIVFLDLQLGTTDGIAQLRALAAESFPGTLVLVSGFNNRVLMSARSIAEGLGLKVGAILEKPLRLDALEQVLARLRIVDEPISAARIMAAIANDELTLAFQPVVTRTPRQLLKLEALLRWDHPVRGRVSPADFLPIAEADVPTIDALGAWVVSAAIDAYQALAEAGLRVPIAINLSPHNLHDLRLPDFIEARMRAGGMPAGDLHVEVTETAALADNVDTLDVLSRLRLKGIALSIDDFGTGYASLRVLQRMPYSEIKIDRTFITDMTKSRDSLAIVKSMIDLATNMQMKCVAEGIETEDTAALLEQLGVSALQGNLFAKPMSPEALPAWWTTWTQQPPPRAVGIAVAEKPLQADSSPSRDDSELAAPAGDPGAPSPRLPPRQSQIMQLVAEGLTVKEIARRLGLGAGTVKVHLALAYSALGARNRIDAIRRLATIGHLSTGPATTIADDLAPRGHASIAIAL